VRSRRGTRAQLPAEAALVWLPALVVGCAVFVTYSRLPARELYHVSGSGLVGGASRALVFANFPVALIALAVAAVLFDRLASRAARALAVLAAVLCAAVFWPGVVSQANLDAKPVNAVAAGGVALVLALAAAVARGGIEPFGRRRLDGVRIVLALGLLVLAAPWVAAELGFFLDGVPLLGRLFRTGPPAHALTGLPRFPPFVHHGHHHGMDGLLLVVAALLLSRTVPDVRIRMLRAALAGYLALMLCYGLGNIANDFWTEQVVKRGWSAWQFPNVLEPSATPAWGVIVVAAATLALVARARSIPR
jgi:hypothetical protein